MIITTRSILLTIAGTVLMASTALAAEAKPGSFAKFDARRRKRLLVKIIGE